MCFGGSSIYNSICTQLTVRIVEQENGNLVNGNGITMEMAMEFVHLLQKKCMEDTSIYIQIIQGIRLTFVLHVLSPYI